MSRKFFSLQQSNQIRQMKELARSLGMESESASVEIERERMMFGLIKDVSVLKSLTPARQTQFEIKIPKSDKNALGGKIRVREEIIGDAAPTYTLTVKTLVENNDANVADDEVRSLEINHPVDKNVYKAFQYLAEGGMTKNRYEFPIEGTDLKWEFDIFPGPDGQPQGWCKIDLELPEGGLAEQPPFPIEMERIISSNPENQTEEEKTILDTLFATVFKFNNPHLK